jgi:hypothetical protein
MVGEDHTKHHAPKTAARLPLLFFCFLVYPHQLTTTRVTYYKVYKVYKLIKMATKTKKGAAAAPLTPVERMEDMALTSRVSEATSPHFQGLTDKTLTEFIIHLAETQLKQGAKRQDDILTLSQGYKTRLVENGAAPDIPLSVCRRLLEWVQDQLPRMKRWRLKQEEKQRKKMKGSGASTSASGNVTSSSKNPLLQSFPGLAKPNLNHSVDLGTNFFEHTKTHTTSNKNDIESSKRKLSNLPAWMTTNDENTKRSKVQSGDSSKNSSNILEPYTITQARVEKTLDFGVIVKLLLKDDSSNNNNKEAVAYKSQLPTNYQKNDFRKGQTVWVKILSIHPGKSLGLINR